MMKKRYMPILLLSGIALAATAVASDQAPNKRNYAKKGKKHMVRSASVERMAMQNLMAEQLSQSTGRDVNEIKALFAETRPMKAAEELGLDREAMRDAMQAARASYIERSLAAGLITQEQAETLAATPPRGKRSQR